MTSASTIVRHFWRPRAVASVAVPLLLIIAIDFLVGLLPRPWLGQWQDPVHYGQVLVSALLGLSVVRGFTRALGYALDDYLGLGRARSIATLTSVVLYSIVILIAVAAVGQSLSGLLVGGALTGVIVGIAGQASLSNIIAGLVILFARPYSAGMYVTARAGAFGGVEYSGQVWDISLFYTTLHSGEQEIRIPNNAMVGAVIVSRAQELDVNIAVTLPRTIDLTPTLDELRSRLAGAMPGRTPRVTLESVTDVGYVTTIRVSIASESERHALEGALAGVIREVAAVTETAQHEPAPAESVMHAAGAASQPETPGAEDEAGMLARKGTGDRLL